MYTRLNPVIVEMVVLDLWAFGIGVFLITFLWREQLRSRGISPSQAA
jgi:hypothetical protein